MKDTQLYRQILSIEKPLKVIDEMVSPQDDEVKVIVEQCVGLGDSISLVRAVL